jgi:hypothetical protein
VTRSSQRCIACVNSEKQEIWQHAARFGFGLLGSRSSSAPTIQNGRSFFGLNPPVIR